MNWSGFPALGRSNEYETLNCDPLWMYLLCVKIIIQSFAFKGYGGGGGGYQMRSWNLRVPRCCHPGHWSSLVSPTLNEAQDMGKTEKTAVSPRCFATQCFPQTSLHVHWFCFNCFINLEAFLSLWKKTNPSCHCQFLTELLWPRTVSVMQGKGKYDRDHGAKGVGYWDLAVSHRISFPWLLDDHFDPSHLMPFVAFKQESKSKKPK